MARRLFHEDGTPIKKMKSDMRSGITGRPMETGELQINQNIPPVHGYFHILDHFENIGFTFNARHAFQNPEMPIQGMGKAKSDYEKQAILDAKNEFMQNAKKKDGFNFPLRMPGISLYLSFIICRVFQ